VCPSTPELDCPALAEANISLSVHELIGTGARIFCE
jgi:hypothetical protein